MSKKIRALYRCSYWKEQLFIRNPRRGGNCGNFSDKHTCLLKGGGDCDAVKLPICVGTNVRFRCRCQDLRSNIVENISLMHDGRRGIFCEVNGLWWPMDSLMTEEEWKQNNDIARD